MNFTIEADEEQYRICADGNESAVVDYGEIATLMIGKDIYYACCDLDAKGEITDDTVYRVDSVSAMPATVEDVDFPEDEEEDEEEAEVEAEEEEEEEEVLQ